MKLTPAQRRALIEATIEPLFSFRRGFARSKSGPFFESKTVEFLVRAGALRPIRYGAKVLFTARSE